MIFQALFFYTWTNVLEVISSGMAIANQKSGFVIQGDNNV